LKQILSNLIGNALKFTEAGSVTVTCELKRPHLAFRVTDSGAGIPQEKHAEVFEPFYQVDSSMTRRQSGAGLGLTLARQLARALGGDVWLAVSAPGKGSEFVATVAMRPAASAFAGTNGPRRLSLIPTEAPPIQ
jgi:signal transduction histidine kinase